MGGWLWLTRLVAFAAIFIGSAFVLSGGLLWIRPASAGMPSPADPWGAVPAFLGAWVATWYLVRRLEGRALESLGFRGGTAGLGDLGAGFGAGIVLIGAVTLSLAGAGWASWTGEAGGSPLAAAVTLLPLLFVLALAEELLFRGYPFQALARRFGPALAIGGTSFLFGVAHGWNPDVTGLALVNITLAGILLGVAYWRTRSLWFVTGLHLGWNWVMAVTDLSVSGLAFEMPGYEASLSGPASWTGGTFGPEGGLLVTAASLAGIVWMWRMGARGESLWPPMSVEEAAGRGGEEMAASD